MGGKLSAKSPKAEEKEINRDNPIYSMLVLGLTFKVWQNYAIKIGKKVEAATQNELDYYSSDEEHERELNSGHEQKYTEDDINFMYDDFDDDHRAEKKVVIKEEDEGYEEEKEYKEIQKKRRYSKQEEINHGNYLKVPEWNERRRKSHGEVVNPESIKIGVKNHVSNNELNPRRNSHEIKNSNIHGILKNHPHYN